MKHKINLLSRMGMTNTPPCLRVNGSSKFLKSLALLFVLMLGVGNVWGQTTDLTYTHAMSAKPTSGDNALSNVTWTVDLTSNVGDMNTANYAGVQIGTSKATGSIKFTSKKAWGEETGSYKGYTKVKYVYVWLNNGSGTISADVTIGGVSATKSGTVSKNTSAGKDYSKTSKLTFTPGANGDEGVIEIVASTSSKAGYFCAIEVVCEEGGKTKTTTTFGSDVDDKTFEVTQGGASFTKTATLDPSAAGSLTYSSSNTNVATVNSSTGEVTIVAPGTTTIKAEFEGNDTYSGSSAQYNVKVNPKGTATTYTVSSVSDVSTDANKPDGSDKQYTQTYSSKCQITVNNSATLTLTGYEGLIIRAIKLNMKSNSSAGAGTFSAKAGTTTLAEIAESATFDKWYDNTAYSTSYKDILVTMLNSNYTIQKNENVVIKIAASISSLYINSYTIYYEAAQQRTTTPTITPADGTEYSTATQEVSITAADGATIYYTTDGTTPDNTKTLYNEVFTISGTKTIKAIAYKTDFMESLEATSTITYVAPVVTHNITCSAPEGGTYTVQVGNEAAQTITEATVIQGGEGKTITMTIAASAGYKPQSTPFVVKDADEAPVDVSKDGNNYSFTMPSKAVTITAKYSKLYTIGNSVTGNGTIAIKDKDGNVITETSSGSKVVVDVNPETGYQLTELYYIKQDESEHNAITATENVYSFNMGEKNVTVYATFSAKVLNITYKDQNNADFSGVHGDNYPTTHTYGTETSLVSPTKDHYQFEGWFGNSECTGNAVTSIPGDAYTVDFTLYAKWEINKHSVTYVLGDDASGCANLENQAYGTEITVCTSQQKPHHNFTGWTVTEGGITIENDKFIMPDNDVTLTANWTAHNKYTVTFADDVQNTDCTGYTMSEAWVGTKIVFPQLADVDPSQIATECEKLHYHFVGWVEDGTAPVLDPSNVIPAGTDDIYVSKTITYKAVWAKEAE